MDTLSDALDRLLLLVSDTPPPADWDVTSAEEFLDQLWAQDQSLCASLVLRSAQYWDESSRLVDAVLELLRRHPEPSLFETVHRALRQVPRSSSVRTWVGPCLIKANVPGAFDRFVADARRELNRITADCDWYSGDVRELLEDIDRFSCHDLVDEIRNLKHTCIDQRKRRRLPQDRAAAVSAVLDRFEHGRRPLVEWLRANDRPIEWVVAYTYSLGCARCPDDALLFMEIFRRHPRWWGFDVRAVAVDALVYSAPLSVTDGFLATELAVRTARDLQRLRRFNADLGVLFKAAFALGTISERLKHEVKRYLDVPSQEMAGLAWLVLNRADPRAYRVPDQMKQIVEQHRYYAHASGLLRLAWMR